MIYFLSSLNYNLTPLFETIILLGRNLQIVLVIKENIALKWYNGKDYKIKFKLLRSFHMGRTDIVSQQDIMNFLDASYKKILDGIPLVSPPIESFANDYLSKYKTKERACKEMLNNQILKCTTSGVISGFGGILTLPVAIPANIANVLYVQMRMIACTAYMAGYDLKSDQTQTLAYACLAGVAINQILKKAGIKLCEKMALKMIEKIPGKVLIKINQKVGFRLVTKFGSKGILNFGKLIPGVGAIVGGGLDYTETRIIASRSYDWFFKNNYNN